MNLGPQNAPQDYRIANRPGNPNWHGVKAWFDEAAKPKPYHERATVHIPQCPKCGAKDFYVTPEELSDAGGVIACEYCETLISPARDYIQAQSVTVEQAAPLAQAKRDDFLRWVDQTDDYTAYMMSVYGAEMRDTPRDWKDLRGDCAL